MDLLDESDAVAIDNESISVHVVVSSTAAYGNYTSLYINQSHHLITKVMEQYTMPVICLFGIIANTLASIVFLRKPLRNSSCGIFLAVRGISDNGFLSTLLLIWISSTFELHLSKVLGLCQINVFLTYVCGCISVWLVMFVTAENYIRICKPFIVNRVCKTSTAKIAVLILCLLVCCSYTFPFWATESDCTPKEYYYDTIQAMVYTDTLLTLVIPTLFVSLLMICIICNFIKSYNRRGRLRAPTVKRVQNPMAKVTRMLLAVTVTFVCLNLPSHVIRIRLMIRSILSKYDYVSPVEEAIQKIALFVYYSSLSINLIVYLMFGSKFRKVFKETFFRTGSSHSPSQARIVVKKTFDIPRISLTKSLSAQFDSVTKTVVAELVPLNRANSR